jgi:hypothetical protein
LAARQHFIEDTAESENVRAGISRFPLSLLRRHVSGRSHQRPFAGECLVSFPRGETEIENLHPGFRDHDVAGFEIPVNDALDSAFLSMPSNSQKRFCDRAQETGNL